jgi:[Protein-PII] uridylyltransferase
LKDPRISRTESADADESAAIFSTRRVAARLEAAGDDAVAVFRDTLAWGRERLEGMFHEGTPADALVHARAQLVDEVLCRAWRRVLPESSSGLGLVAVGGYGRAELLPHSDIDLLLLHDDDALARHQAALEKFFAFLWDIGLEVGSAVRAVDECIQLAASDITVITNLIESRPLCGDPTLHAALANGLTPDHVWPVADFVKAKLAEQAQRHGKYDDTGYKLEPNVKEGPGGLRDIHTIVWVSKRQFGALTLGELRERGLLTKAEADELFAAQDFLWRVRFALHMIAGRHEDRLLFDHQVRVAELFGYVDGDHNRAVEQFMQLYYRTVKTVSCLNEMLLQLFEQRLDDDSGRTPATSAIDDRFLRIGNRLDTTDDEVFKRDPVALLEAFALFQRHPDLIGMRAGMLRQVRRDAVLIDEAVREDTRARALFIGLFRNGERLTAILRRMNRYGVLGRYLPAFGLVVGLMQYDLFHTLTVDEHSLHVVRNLRRLATPEHAAELPFFSAQFKRVPQPEVLYLAALFHDLGKGRGGDHSEIGAEQARVFCIEHGLSAGEADTVAWLVRHHLMMSLTAQRQDLSDPEVINTFARHVGRRDRLDLLLLLTVADIRATNPALWNSWRESLLKELFFASARLLERGLDQPLDEKERIGEVRRAALRMLADRGIDEATAERTWSRFGDDYFLRHTASEIAWHLPAVGVSGHSSRPLVLVARLDERGTTVFVYTRDRDRLFAVSTAALARLGLSVLDARINTTDDGYTLDSYVVMESDGRGVNSDLRVEEIRTAMLSVLEAPERANTQVNRRMSQRLRHFTTPAAVCLSQDVTRGRTVLELVAGDRPGLLAQVGSLLADLEIKVDAAKIATIGERAEDVFYITDLAGQPITDAQRLAHLHDTLINALEPEEAPAQAALS